MVLEGCNGEIVRAIEQCLAVDDARNNSRRSISSSESGSSSQIPTAVDSKITNLSGLNQQNLTGTMGLTGQAGTGAPGLGGPTSPAEFFRNLTSTQNAGRPILPTFPHYMVSLVPRSGPRSPGLKAHIDTVKITLYISATAIIVPALLISWISRIGSDTTQLTPRSTWSFKMEN